jgi:cytoskeletal protein CcmA (bactofilin family)
MSLSVPYFRVHALPVLSISVVLLGLVVLLPLPAQAAEKRFVGDVVVGSGVVETGVSTVAGDVEIRGRVENDVHSGSGNVYVYEDGAVEGDIDAVNGDVEIEGPVDGDVRAVLGDVYVNAPVRGDVDVGRGDVTLGPRAAVDGDVEFGSGTFAGDENAVEGDIVSREMPSGRNDILGFMGGLFAALAFAACTVLAAVLAPRPLASAARRAEESPGRSFVYGLVSLPVFFVLCVVLAVSIVGIPLLVLLTPAYLALLFFGALVAAFFLGTKVLMVTGRYRVGNALAAVVGALILAATTLIPVLGDLLLFALALLGTGAAILALFSRRPRPTHPSYEAYVRDRAGG